ncbi:MAG: hypothetical protein GF317_23695 [Candidatus Lokiarchaeota archaeon]|nr:hypothetical protein [Candidatus Lokiarchaeota archaeon]
MIIKDKIRQFGFSKATIRFWKFLLNKVGIRYEVFYRFTKSLNTMVEITPLKIDVSINELEYSDLKNAILMNFSAQKLGLFKSRFEKGDYIAFGAFHNNNLIYLCWISLKHFEMPYKLQVLNLNHDEGLLLDAYCHPEYRGMGLHSTMNKIRLNKLLELGKKKAVGIVLKENLPAIKVQERSGLKKSSTIKYIKIFNWQKLL